MKRKHALGASITVIIVLALGASAFSCNREVPQPKPPALASSEVSVHVRNVGEGLSILIDDGETEVLIYGGFMKHGEDVSAYISKYVDGNIEYVIATHSDSDHVGGLIQIYADYQVDCTIYGDESTTSNYPKFKEAALNEPNSKYRNDTNETIILSEGVTLRTEDVTDDAKKTNDNSVISVLNVGGQKLLITGDAEAQTESLLLGRIGRVDVYVVGHHGSETSSSQALLDEIRSRYGIISTAGPTHKDRNPDEQVITRLSGIGAVLYATYRSGNIVVTFDGVQIYLSPPTDEQITLQNYKEVA